jgi:hypothetical protein
MAEITREQAAAFADVVCHTAILNLTLRDLFAGFALIGIIQADDWSRVITKPENVATDAYKLADAMLVQRNEDRK